ncbi:uncharacterized protein [Montipora capricornis]|uniref:uncharacterized protein n=1 Tax=Montipora capricornis TaxID=246305 RepID=UPI0035F16C6B
MTSQKQSLPSFTSIVSIMSIVFCCAGFLRVEFELCEHKKRIIAIEGVVEVQPPTSRSNFAQATKNFPELEFFRLRRRRADSALTCPLCPPGPSGPPGPKGEKGSQGRRGKTGRNGKKGDQGNMGSPGKIGKQGIMGPQGEAGPKGQKGNVGLPGKLGAKGEPGESISAPTVAVSPAKMTVNESESASFQCSVTGNPEPTVVWSRVINQSEMNHSAISGKTLRLRNVKGSEAGIYRCSATSLLGKARAESQLVINFQPSISLHPGPLYISEGSNVTLPNCHVTGHPDPDVKWRKSFGQLTLGRVLRNNEVMRIADVRKADSGDYIYTATNLLGIAVRKTILMVVSLPRFTMKPPVKAFARTGDSLTLNCSATGDPQPVISWKRQGSPLPAGRNQLINGALVIRDVRKKDAGIYICVASSAGVFYIETVTLIEILHKDCSDLFKSGETHSGVYSIDPDGKGSFNVYCDMHTDGAGWTVFQRRRDGSVDFYRGWNDYKSGFGHLTAEFWLGNDKIHRLTASIPSSLRVELEDLKGVKAYAKYGRFSIRNEQALYRLEVSSYSGTAGDSLITNHNNMAFTTKDRDNDRWSGGNCAVYLTGAWWYKSCSESNLNGKYLLGKSRGVRWDTFRHRLDQKTTEMKLRPSSHEARSTCQVTGHPTPEVKWGKLLDKLPQGRVLRNNTCTVMKLEDVRKSDSAEYICTATNLSGTVLKKTLLVVVSLPRFLIKPPVRIVASLGYSLKLNCSATGDTQPVISWKRQGSSLPGGRNQQINGALVIRNVTKEDGGNYICVATSAGVSTIETVSYVEVRRPRDCSDLLNSGQTHSGVYSVDPDDKGFFNVYCDMRTDGGGWTVFQRRQDGSIDFHRGWNDYKSGFGQLTAEFWLGNDKIHRLTASRPSSLRVQLEDWNGGKAYAKYGRFNIGNEQAQYRLEVSLYSGTAGDSLAWHNNMAFSTKDRDDNCAVRYTGGWWYNNCHQSNLNGRYVGEKRDRKGTLWVQFRDILSLKFTEMKVRP